MYRIIINQSALLLQLVTFIILNSNDQQQQVVLAFKLNLPLNINSIHGTTTTTATTSTSRRTRTATHYTTFYPRRNNERRRHHHDHRSINFQLYSSYTKSKIDITTNDSNNNNPNNNISSIINNHHLIHANPTQKQQQQQQQQPSHDEYTIIPNNNKNNTTTINIIPGSHKWLGGAIDPIDGSIYGIPSHASSILRIRRRRRSSKQQQQQHQPDVDDDDDDAMMEYLPLPSNMKKGKFKWLRGIITSDGKYLYGIPSWGRSVMRLTLRGDDDGGGGGGEMMMNEGDNDDDGHDHRFTLLELPPLVTANNNNNDENDNEWQWMWHGATITKNSIYCIPSNANRILKIDLLPSSSSSNNITSYIGPDLSSSSSSSHDVVKNKWYGGIKGYDNAVYGIPYQSSFLLRIDAVTEKVELLGSFEGDYKWHGGVYSPINGAIYAFPSHARSVLKIDTMVSPPKMTLLDINVTTTITTTGLTRDEILDQKYKWGGGVIGSNDMIYGMPSDATSILRINPYNDDVTTFGGSLSDRKNKWQGGVLGDDGWIYAIPADADHVLRIDTRNGGGGGEEEEERVQLVGDLSKKKKKWQGGFVLRGGSGKGGGVIYGIPENAERILRIVPARDDDDCCVQEL